MKKTHTETNKIQSNLKNKILIKNKNSESEKNLKSIAAYFNASNFPCSLSTCFFSLFKFFAIRFFLVNWKRGKSKHVNNKMVNVAGNDFVQYLRAFFQRLRYFYLEVLNV